MVTPQVFMHSKYQRKHRFGSTNLEKIEKGLQLSFLKLLSLTVWFLKFIFVARNV